MVNFCDDLTVQSVLPKEISRDYPMKTKTTLNNPITEGVIWQQILLYFFPLLVSSFFQQLYNTADAVIVGQAAGKEALSAVGGSAGSVLGIFLMFYVGFGGGAAVPASQHFGAKKEAALRTTIRTSLWISALLGILGMVICFGFAGPILTLMNTPADVMVPSLWYLRITAFGMLPNALYNMGACTLRAIGDVRRPLAVLIITCLTNIALDLLLVVRFGLGAVGAAIATSLCQLFSALLILWCLRRAMGKAVESIRSGFPHAEDGPAFSNQEAAAAKISAADTGLPSLKRSSAGCSGVSLTDSFETAVRILRIGLPLGFTEVMYTFANTVLMAIVNGFGTDTVAAYAAYCKIEFLFWMIVGSFGISITTFVGQNIGAGRWDRVRQSIRESAVMMYITQSLVIVFLYFGAEFLQGLFSRDPAVVSIGTDMMHFLLPFYILYVPIEILFGALRGMGDSLIPTLLTFIGICVTRCVWGLLVVPLHHTINMVLLSFAVSWIVTSAAFILYYRRYARKHFPQ